MPTFSRHGICSAGHWLIDWHKQIDLYPAPDGLASIQETIRSTGGGAFNLAIDLTKLGADFPIFGLGLIGADREGDWIVEQCGSAGVDTKNLRRSREFSTAFTDVMTEQGSGRRTFFYSAGANAQLSLAEFDSLEQIPAQIFYLGYPGLLPGLEQNLPDGQTGVEHILERAAQCGMLTAIDCVSSASANWPAIRRSLRHCDFVFLNDLEAQLLLGKSKATSPARTTAASVASARALIGCGVRGAVVLHTENNAICCTAGGETFTRGAVHLPSSEMRGTCGAGDALAAGFLFGVQQAMEVSAALELGVCAAATCLREVSASQGILRAPAALAYGRGLGFRHD
jgi:sugar/nucleoside kinase (ribokinase family)